MELLQIIIQRGIFNKSPPLLFYLIHDNTKKQPSVIEFEYEVLVDNVVAKENVSRFVMHQGYQVNVEEQGDDFLLKITK